MCAYKSYACVRPLFPDLLCVLCISCFVYFRHVLNIYPTLPLPAALYSHSITSSARRGGGEAASRLPQFGAIAIGASLPILSLVFAMIVTAAPRRLTHRISTSTCSSALVRQLCAARSYGCRVVRTRFSPPPPSHVSVYRKA